MTFTSAPQGNDFVGARPYDDSEARLFFGRQDEIRDLASLWRGNRLTILHSANGAGKTSLVRAGVIPTLRSKAWPLPVGVTPSARVWPTAALPHHNPYLVGLLSSWEPDEMPARLAGMSLSDYLRRPRRDNLGDLVTTLAAIDQAETFLRPPTRHEQHARRFAEELFTTLAKVAHVNLLLIVRTEHLDELLRLVKASGITEQTAFELRPLSPATTAEVLTRTLERRGRRPDPELIDDVLDELRTVRDENNVVRERLPAVDPAFLQLVGSAWNGSAPDVDAVLSRYCAEELARVAADFAIPARTLDAWVKRSPGTGVPEPVVHALEDRYLVRESGRVHPRLRAPLRRLNPIRRPDVTRTSHDLLNAAARMGFAGEFTRAEKVLAGVRGTGDTRTRADTACLQGNLAFEQDRLAEAEHHYETAAELYETLHDSGAVSWTLAALGRVALKQGRRASAIEELRAAVSRAPHDLTVRTSLGEVLWEAGQPRAALSVLSGVVDREADMPGARRLQHAIIADLEKS